MKKFWEYAAWIGSALAVGGLSGLLIREGVGNFQAAVEKPLLTPPMWVFPAAWTVLYLLMGLGAARVRRSGKEVMLPLAVYWIQLGVNFCWPLLFFNRKAYLLSLGWLVGLWVLAAAMAWLFWKIDRAAGLLQVPYLLWLLFAGYLNYGVWMLNR